jgi:hypothetical protein
MDVQIGTTCAFVGHASLYHSASSSDQRASFTAARSARFEHGERP